MRQLVGHAVVTVWRDRQRQAGGRVDALKNHFFHRYPFGCRRSLAHQQRDEKVPGTEQGPFTRHSSSLCGENEPISISDWRDNVLNRRACRVTMWQKQKGPPPRLSARAALYDAREWLQGALKTRRRFENALRKSVSHFFLWEVFSNPGGLLHQVHLRKDRSPNFFGHPLSCYFFFLQLRRRRKKTLMAVPGDLEGLSVAIDTPIHEEIALENITKKTRDWNLNGSDKNSIFSGGLKAKTHQHLACRGCGGKVYYNLLS